MDEPSLSEARPPPASADEVNEDHQTNQTNAQADKSDSCSSCDKPAKYVCIFCERAPDATGYPLEPTRWCSAECQTADWEHHEVCRAAQNRQRIYEKGAALQREHREYCRDFVMELVQAGTLDASHMIMHEKDSVQCVTDAITLLHDTKGNIEERRAFFACMDASARLLHIRKVWKKRLLASNVCAHVHDRLVSLKTARRRYIRQDRKLRKEAHRILHVIMKNGEEYAVDVSGDQFGPNLSTPVMPWRDYLAVHVDRIHEKPL